MAKQHGGIFDQCAGIGGSSYHQPLPQEVKHDYTYYLDDLLIVSSMGGMQRKEKMKVRATHNFPGRLFATLDSRIALCNSVAG